MASPRLLIATSNRRNFREFCDLLGELPLHLQSRAEFDHPPVVAEEGATYAVNAIHKAVTLAQWSGTLTLADDSGLEVDALGGAPGLHSARYAGAQQDARANVAKLLNAL